MIVRRNYLVLAYCFVVGTSVAAVPSTQANKTLNTLATRSVKDFGAVGDGKADDTAAIEAAVKAGEGAIYFPKGDYLISRPVIADLNMRGRGSLVGTGTACVIMAGAGPAFHFIGTHEGTGDPESVREPVWERQRMPIITGLEIRGGHKDAVGLLLEKTMQATLSNMLIRHCRTGVHLVKRNRNVIIDQCHIYHNTEIGIDFDRVNLHQAIISDSHISYNALAGIRLLGGNMRNFQIVGNDIEYNHDTQKESSADVLIDMRPEGSSFREGTIVGNTIQARPSPGGANVKFLGGKNLNTGGLMAISGNLIGSQTTNIHLVNCRGVSISGNSIYSAAEHSLWLQNCANVVAGDNSMDWNPDHRGKRLADGILIEKCQAVVLSDSIIENCFQGSAESGGAIDVKASEDVMIVNCQVLDPRYRGITLVDAVRCRVSGCSIIDRREKPLMRASIEVKGGRENMIAGNIVNRGSLAVEKGTAIVRGNVETAGEK
jgi:hypothetical protein